MKKMILATLAAGVMTASAGPPPPMAMKHTADPCGGPISYNSAELVYAYTDFDDFDDEGNGVQFRVEYSAWENFYVVGGVGYHEADNVDMWVLSGGAGGYVALTENIHLVGEAGVLWTSFDSEVFVDDIFVSDRDEEWGWYGRPHVRAKWGCFEAQAGALYEDLGGDFDDEWSGFVNLYYQVAPGWDLTAGVNWANEATTVTGGARYRY